MLVLPSVRDGVVALDQADGRGAVKPAHDEDEVLDDGCGEVGPGRLHLGDLVPVPRLKIVPLGRVHPDEAVETAQDEQRVSVVHQAHPRPIFGDSQKEWGYLIVRFWCK